MVKELVPEARSFLSGTILFASLLIIFGGATAITSTFFDADVTVALPACIAASLLLVAYQRGKLNREAYRVEDERFHMQRGSWFTSQDITVEGRKVTDVELRLPFLRNFLFGTGDIYIETAGGRDAEIIFQDVANPGDVFDAVIDTLRESGHQLSSDERLAETKPTRRGAIVGALGSVAGVVGFLFLVAGNLLVLAEGGALILAGLGVLGLGVGVGLWRYNDTVCREYTVFADRLEIREGWLTRHHFVIPGEKLSDSETTQGLLDRVLGLHTVTVSSKGSGGAFTMLYLDDAFGVQEALDTVESSLSELADYEETQPTTGQEDRSDEEVVSVEGWTVTPDTVRSLALPGLGALTGLFLVLFFSVLPPVGLLGAGITAVAVPALLFTAVLYLNTEYAVKEQGVSSVFDFIISSRTHFSFEKVTGVVERRTPLDYVFGTKQLVFWSIGSDQTLRMKHLDLDDSQLQSVLAAHGVSYDDPVETYKPKMTAKTFFLAFLPVHVPVVAGVSAAAVLTPFGVASAVATLTVYAVVLTYLSAYYRRAHVDLYPESLRVSRGIFYQETYHLVLDDVKDISSTTYPWVTTGSITFNAAGERVVQSNNGKQTLPYQTGVGFLVDVRGVHQRIDSVILGDAGDDASERRSYSVTGQPDLANLFVLAGVLLPLTIVFFWAVPFMVWRRRCKWYGLSEDHVVARQGILFKEEKTVRYGKIDHVNETRGWRNKVCGNRSLAVQTTGSGASEVSIADVSNYQAFKDDLVRHR